MIRLARKALRRLLAALPLAVALVVVAAAPGCHPPRPAAHHVETGVALAYTSAVVALELLDEMEAQHIASLDAPTDAQLEAAETRVRRLELARDSLALTLDYLTGGRTTDDVRGPLRDGVALLRQVIEAEGVRVPPRAAEALRVAEAWLGGDGAS